MLVLQLASPIGLLQIGPSSHPLASSRPMRQGDHLVDDRPDSRLVEFVIGHLMFALLHALDHARIQDMGLPLLGRKEMLPKRSRQLPTS
jgi:hypothetical protein